MHVLPAKPPLVTHPPVVYAGIESRLEPIDDAVVLFDRDRATRRASRADAVGRLEEPDTLVHQEVLVEQTSNRTDVNHVALQLVFERLTGKDVDLGAIAAIDHA